MKRAAFFLLLLLVSFNASLFCQNAPKIIWQKTYGGSGAESAKAIATTPDGGYIVVGLTGSKDGDVSGNHGTNDFWVVKLDRDGNIIWQRTLGGSNLDLAQDVAVTPDGGYIVVGWTRSNDGDVSGNHGMDDVWVVKLDKDGNVIWKKTYGGSDEDYAFSIIATKDGGYIFAGWTRSNDGDVSNNHSPMWWTDVWVVKIDKDGNIIWEKTYGGSDDDGASAIIAAPGGGYIVAGWTESNDGDVSENHGKVDVWILKLDEDVNMIWQKTLGGSNDDIAYSIAATSDGGYIVVGDTGSNDGDVSGWHEGYTSYDNSPSPDFWIIKLGWK